MIPALNAARTLGAQLEALARQAPNFAWEILVCDNGSSDGTADLVRSWTSRLPQVKLIDASARRGASAARNIGAAASRSRMLLFCDADDIVADDWVASMHDALLSASVVAGANDYARLHRRHHFAISRVGDSLITMPYWPQYAAGASNNLAVATAAFEAIGGFDENLRTGEDVDLCWRLQMSGYGLSRCPSAVAFIRKRRGLASVYRQSYSYAKGHEALQLKHAASIRDYWLTQRIPLPGSALTSSASSDLPAVSEKRRSALHRVVRGIRPNGLADAAWRLGEWAARRSAEPSRAELGGFR